MEYDPNDPPAYLYAPTGDEAARLASVGEAKAIVDAIALLRARGWTVVSPVRGAH